MTNQQQPNNQAPTQFTPPRLPYHRAFYEKFGIDISSWKVLCETVWPLAKKSESVIMAWNYCKARRLDPFKRPVHIVPIWDREKSDYIETVWPGIAELRTTAMRTGLYAGHDPAAFGPTVSQRFIGIPKRGGTEVVKEIKFPEWCQVTVYRMVDGARMPFPGPKVYWLETYSRIGRTDLPNAMWEQRPIGQLEKCAEAAALRGAFPEEIGEDYTADEMHGQAIGEMRDITPRPRPEDFQDTPGREQAAGPAEATESEPEPDLSTEQPADDQQQEEAKADDFPGDRPRAEEPKQKTTTKKKAEPEPTSESEEAPLVPGGPIDFLANWNAALGKCKTTAAVDALVQKNAERIAQFSDEDLRIRIDEAATMHKEKLSQ